MTLPRGSKNFSEALNKLQNALSRGGSNFALMHREKSPDVGWTWQQVLLAWDSLTETRSSP